MAMVQTFPTGSGSGSGSNNGFYKTTDSITATIDATTTLDITNISGLSMTDVIIGETIVYDNLGTNAVVTAKNTTNNTIDVKTISTGGTTNYNVDRSGQELNWADGKLSSDWTAVANTRIPFVNTSNSTLAQPSNGAWTIPANTTVEVIFSIALTGNSGTSPNGEWQVREVGSSTAICAVDPYDGTSSSLSGWALGGTASGIYVNNSNTTKTIEAICTEAQESGTKVYAKTSSITIKEMNRIVDQVQYTANNDELEETPVGNIISYMGNSVPKHHLACDGTEYAIGTYPELEAHIIKEFGSINYFGGNGTTTWAVPDLNGEFLRGTGTNSHTNQGNGANVGEHQDGTEHANVWGNNTEFYYAQTHPTTAEASYDSKIGTGKLGYRTKEDQSSGTNHPITYTSRPTNTSVKFCIKYESTYHVIVPSHMYKVNIPFSTVASTASVYATFNPTNIIGDTSLVDTTNNQFIAPMDGWYSVSFNTSQGSSRKVPAIYIERYEGNTKIEEIAMVNGFNTGDTYYSGTISTDVYMKKNQTIKYRVYNTGALSGEASFCLLTANYKDNIIAGGEAYSEEEQVIGTWKNGKPLYMKVLNTGSFTTQANAWKTIINVSSLNIEKLVDHSILGTQNTTSLLYGLLQVINGDLQIYTGGYSMDADGIIIKYTKTTDTAGTYQYKNSLLLTRPDMWEPNTEYDFGGGLYGQRFTGNMPTIAAGNVATRIFQYTISSSAILVSCGGYVTGKNSSEDRVVIAPNSVRRAQQDNTTLAMGWTSVLILGDVLLMNAGSYARDHFTTTDTYDVWVTYKK